MLVKNKLPHMIGKAILVDGEIYKIDSEGFADVPEAVAEKLLKSNYWLNSKKRKPIEAKVKSKKESPPDLKKEEAPSVDTMSKAELVALCEANGVEFPVNATKADLVALLIEAGEE